MLIGWWAVVERAPHPLLSLSVEPPKGTESLTIHMVRVLISRACLRILVMVVVIYEHVVVKEKAS